jgi:2-polyprenyl-3-methyl-5-hydroxy-6-metoxy-1,4-benzoquinol methylase
MSPSTSHPLAPLSPLSSLLTCLQCDEPVEIAEIAARAGYPELGPDGWLRCVSCGERYPIIAGTPRMLDRQARSRLGEQYPAAAIRLEATDSTTPDRGASTRQRTAEGFAYEWSHFGQPRAEWRKNFLDYLRPHDASSLAGKLVLDVGTGSGRHSAQAAALGARVIAVDLGQSIDVARRNVPPEVLTVQADAERLPFSNDRFDLVMSIGVLHHLPDTADAVRELVPFVSPGGSLHVYLYWVPELRWHRQVLRLVTAARRLTTRLPYGLLHALCYPLAAALWVGVVVPYRGLRRVPRMAKIADALPLKTYADYPFAVLVNDQFDRFSAPIEHRFTRSQVHEMLERAGLEQVVTVPNHGWVADGVRPGKRSPRDA